MKRRILLFNFIFFMLSVFTGCQDDKQVDYGNATDGQPAEEQAAIEDIQIPDHWDLTIDGAMSSVYVNADIILPDGYKNCSIVEYTDNDFQDEDIKEICDKVFDDDSYFLYMPYSEDARGDLKNKLTDMKATASDEQEIIVYDEVIAQMDTISSYYESDFDSFQELKFYPIYDKMYDREISKCDVMGIVDGNTFLLSFNKDKVNCYMKLTRFNQVANFDKRNVGAQSALVLVDGNVCTYNQEQAENMAREYVAMLGFDSMDIIQTNNVICEHWKGDYPTGNLDLIERRVDGYNIYFGRYYENYSVVYTSYKCRNDFGFPTDFGPGNEPIFGEGNEYIRVYVDSNGISEVEICNPLKFEKVLSEESLMLPYSTVQGIFEENFHTRADGNEADLRVYEIRLGYELVIEGDKKALVPTWFVFYDDSSYDTHYTKITVLRVNALDGTVEYY